jgi:hypothetical protein
MLVACHAGDSSAESTVDRTDALRQRVAHCVARGMTSHDLHSDHQAAWQVFHAAAAYGTDFPLQTPDGERPALAFLFDGGLMNGWELQPGDWRDGELQGLRVPIDAGTKVGQGHTDQWLGYLAMAAVPIDTPITFQGRQYTIESLLGQALWDVPRNFAEEYSWTLMGLARYRGSDFSWTARDGRQWNVEDLVRAELDQDLAAAACGGTHRLQAFAMLLDRRANDGLPIDGIWREVVETLGTCADLARSNQNPDGTFTPNYLYSPGRSRDLGEQLTTTAHVVEFLAMALPAERLSEPWVERGVERLCDLFDAMVEVDIECGALYHGLHGLAVYGQRRWPPAVTQR